MCCSTCSTIADLQADHSLLLSDRDLLNPSAGEQSMGGRVLHFCSIDHGGRIFLGIVLFFVRFFLCLILAFHLLVS